MYRVRTMFRDLADGGHVYEAGDEYPRVGAHPTKERIAELASEKNRRGEPLIEDAGPAKKKAAPKE